MSGDNIANPPHIDVDVPHEDQQNVSEISEFSMDDYEKQFNALIEKIEHAPGVLEQKLRAAQNQDDRLKAALSEIEAMHQTHVDILAMMLQMNTLFGAKK